MPLLASHRRLACRPLPGDPQRPGVLNTLSFPLARFRTYASALPHPGSSPIGISACPRPAVHLWLSYGAHFTAGVLPEAEFFREQPRVYHFNSYRQRKEDVSLLTSACRRRRNAAPDARRWADKVLSVCR